MNKINVDDLLKFNELCKDQTEFYKKILMKGPPGGMKWHPSYRQHLERCVSKGLMLECYDGPIYCNPIDELLFD